jgi:hypothetical protein
MLYSIPALVEKLLFCFNVHIQDLSGFDQSLLCLVKSKYDYYYH